MISALFQATENSHKAKQLPPHLISNIKLVASGTMLTITASFTDQDGDTGKINIKVFGQGKINVNDGFIDLTSSSNSARLDYDAVNQHFKAAGTKVDANINFS